LFDQLGLYEAPVVDTSDPLPHGYGSDALAFQFNRNGVLIAPPAYIAQEQPNDFYMRQIGTLTRGRSTTRDVEALFGHGHSRANRPDGFMWYYACRFIIHSKPGRRPLSSSGSGNGSRGGLCVVHLRNKRDDERGKGCNRKTMILQIYTIIHTLISL
jgi:hypothetical protein